MNVNGFDNTVLAPPAHDARESAGWLRPLRRLAPATILLVEDEVAVRLVVNACLNLFGHRVLEAANAKEALDLWRQHSLEIELLFTDMAMPEGVTGLELAERLRTEKPGLPVIISSGSGAETLAESDSAQRNIVCLPKPFLPSVLQSTVQACLGGKQ